MKNLFLVIFVSMLTVSAKAATEADKLPANILAQKTTTIMFAPPEYRGKHLVQVTTTGMVQSVDIKGNVTALAQLSDYSLLKLKYGINQVKSKKLSKPEGPMCSDAPSSVIEVRREDGKNYVVWGRSNCQEVVSLDDYGAQVAELVNSLSVTNDLLKRF